MNILVAGHKGFIGSAVARKVEAAGHTLLRFDRNSFFAFDPVGHSDVVINCVGETKDEDDMVEANVIFTARLARACHVYEKKFIHVGSIVERVFKPYSFYHVTKLEAYRHVLDYVHTKGSNFCVVRPATVFGPGDRNTSFIPSIIDAYCDNGSITIKNEKRDWIHVDDLATALVGLANIKNLQGLTIEIGHNRAISNLDLFSHICRVLKKDIKFTVGNFNYDAKWQADTALLGSLGLSPKDSFESQVADYVIDELTKREIFLGAEA